MTAEQKSLIRAAMITAENLPMGGIGKDGPTQEELDKASENGHPIGDDAVYHAGQEIWLFLNRALEGES